MKTGYVLLASIVLGAGLAILASFATGYSWYSSRHWDTSAVQATFDHLEKGDANRIDFCYELKNNTSSDYYVDINAQPTLMAMVTKPHPFSFGYQVLVLQHPIRVQAGQRSTAKISFGKTPIQQLNRVRSSAEQAADSEQLLALVHEQYGQLQGFVLYDLQRRYRINFPKPW